MSLCGQPCFPKKDPVVVYDPDGPLSIDMKDGGDYLRFETLEIQKLRKKLRDLNKTNGNLQASVNYWQRRYETLIHQLENENIVIQH